MKRKTVIWLTAIFALLFAVSIWKNVSAAKETDRMEAVMTAETYHLLYDIAYELEHIVSVPGARPLDEQTGNKLIHLSNLFNELHATQKIYATCFQTTGSRNSYSGLFDFQYIARTLVAGRWATNGVSCCGIMKDGQISNKEAEYLSRLREDIAELFAALSENDNPPAMKQDINPYYMDNQIKTFFEKWSWHSDNQPYRLLME